MDTKHIPLDQCKNRHLYRINSRNLSVGIYSEPTKGFLGIRQKFDDFFVAEEYHYDTGVPHGTAKPLEDLGFILPEEILLKAYLPGVWCNQTGREIQLRTDGERGWIYVDTGEAASGYGHTRNNKELFDWLINHQKTLANK